MEEVKLSRVSQLSRKKPQELRIPIMDEPKKKKKKRARRSCVDWFQAGMLTIVATILVVLCVSAFGPAGKVNKTILQVSDMVDKVNRSGLADVVVAVVNNWQTGNHTQQTFALINALYQSGGQVTDIVMAIQPEIVKELANRTSITVSGLLTLAETIISNQGIDITIPLGNG